MSKRPRGATKKGLEIRDQDLTGEHGVVSRYDQPAKEDVCYVMTLSIGMAGEPGADLFYVRVATPEALASRAPERPAVMASRAIMIVSDFDWETIQSHIEETVKICSAPTWNESRERLVRYFSWEYEDIQDAERARTIAQISRD
jgi:hypothetical protein